MLKLYLLGLAILLTVTVGVSRVYLGVHWPTDVGRLIGAAWALFCWAAALWLQRRGQVEGPPRSRDRDTRPADAEPHREGDKRARLAVSPRAGTREWNGHAAPSTSTRCAAPEWDALIAAMENALIDFSAGRVQQPVRRLLSIERHGGFFGVMPAVGAQAMGAKLVTFPATPRAACPRIWP